MSVKEQKGLVFYGKKGIVFSKNYKELIFENIKRILNTARGERINNLAFGSDVKKYLFLPEMRIVDLANEVKNSIERCEPRVTVLSCDFSKDQLKEDTFNILVKLKLDEINETEELIVSV